ncbi:MAG TPA: acyl-CoA dehydrogenase family protein [Candidatus Binataceae bacterium]|nr:acyl-CoA dehydrogenase family protein [Candidatus Binataceae bacterium]
MDFGFSEEQEMLRASARNLLEKECPTTVVRRLMEDERGYDAALWRKMAELGWTGLVIPEELGGSGLSYVDLVLVMEEMGRVVLPAPFIWTVMVAEALKRAGSAAQQQALLPKIAAGELIATLAWLEPSGGWDAGSIKMAARPDGSGFTLDGVKLFVNDAHLAECLLVAARSGGVGEDGVTLFAIEKTRPGITVTPLKTMDQTRKLSAVNFSGVRVNAADVVGQAGGGWQVLAPVLDRGKVMLAAEMIGGAQRVLDMTVEYAKVRVQFGRPIGSFQAIQHKCANMMVDVEGARSAIYYAAWAVSNEVPEAPVAAAVAKAAASDAYRRVAAEGIQCHGGIGFTWDHDLHLYFKRAKASEFTFGDATYNRELIAQGINL